MIEQRASQRKRIFKTGLVAFGRPGVACIVRNISESGACLETGPGVDIPATFTLAIEQENLIRRCHVIWRKEKRIGVVFD